MKTEQHVLQRQDDSPNSYHYMKHGDTFIKVWIRKAHIGDPPPQIRVTIEVPERVSRTRPP
jgi:hypothetical protein